MAEPNGYIQGINGVPLELVDSKVRQELPKKLTRPATAQVGDYLRIKAINSDGAMEVEAVPSPTGGNVDLTGYATEVWVQELLAAFPTFEIEVVQELPAAGAEKTIYLVPFADDSGSYLEYLYVNGAWEVVGSGKDSGENVDQVSIEPAEDDIPCVYFYTGGVGMPFTKNEGDVQMRMAYTSKTMTANYYITAKVQGGSSASNSSYKKRNWTIKFYEDNTYDNKLKVAFKGWSAMNKFVLKAGWVIPGHLRNVGAAKVWGQIMRTRSDFDALPEELRNSPNQGATDGFHVRVFVDGMYWGIYDWIVAKDQLFGQDKDNASHSILNSELNNQPTCAFATTSPTISGNWSEELLDDITDDTKASMENWIKFVAGATDEEFVANAENYFDVQSVIDANCFDRILMPVDNMCRNQIVFKYDTKWFMGKWDLDAILGLPPVAGQSWYAYNTAYQEGYVAYKDFGIINMLYSRTESLFLERFKARYWELRNGPLSENNLVQTFGHLSDRLRSIEGLLAEENASTTGNGEFTAMPNVEKDTIQQVREFVVKRCAYMDGVVDALVGSVPCTGISLNTNTLTFTAEGSQTLTATVTPDGCTDVVTWESNNASVASVNGGVVTAVANGNATITAKCGEYSASCSVAVSGITEPIPCTGITLDKTELTFDGEGTQTITATVTPSDTTDTAVWVSSAPNVASITVEGNVCTVQSISNGDATITVTCGEYSASCSVSVSGIEIGAVIIEDGLVMHLDAIDNTADGHDANATTWSDLSGNGNDATLEYDSNAPTWSVNGLVFGAVAGSSNSTGYIDFVDKELSEFTVAVTFTAGTLSGAPSDANKLFVGTTYTIDLTKNNTTTTGTVDKVLGATHKGVKDIKSTLATNVGGMNHAVIRYKDGSFTFTQNGTSETIAHSDFEFQMNTSGATGYDALSNITLHSVLVYDRCLTDNEVSAITNYNAERYGS